MYAKEVVCHWEKLNDACSSAKLGPRPKAWMLSRIHEWLIDNPIIDTCDIAFLQETVAHRKQIAEDSVKEAAEENTRLGSSYWNSMACM